MAKKKICIFIGSSIVEFKEERMELENFIHRLSNDFEDRYDTRVIPVVCEAFDPAMARTRKQDDSLESMRGCELCFLLFYTRAGADTIEAVRGGYQTFLETGAPKVYVYFKELGQDEKIEPSLTKFMTEVDKTYDKIYYIMIFENKILPLGRRRLQAEPHGEQDLSFGSFPKKKPLKEIAA